MFATRPLNLTEVVEFGDRARYPEKARQTKHNLYAESDTLYRSDYESIKTRVLYGGPTPYGEGMELVGRV